MQHSLLIVEDDADLRLLYKMFLKSEGYTVHGAATGEEGWKLLEEHDVALILLDLTLPTMSGAEFIARLRGDSSYAQCKVIVLSGWDELERKALEMQADDFALKPVQMPVLKQKIEALLGTRGCLPGKAEV